MDDHSAGVICPTARAFHDATVDADRTGPWRSIPREPDEVICHYDFATYNLAYTDGVAAGIIDFDFATPAPESGTSPTWPTASSRSPQAAATASPISSAASGCGT